jgi:integrase
MLTLPPLALDILRSVERRDGRDHLFGTRGQGFVAWGHSKAAFKVDIQAWTLHDLRRSVATHLAEIGIEPHIVEAILNHVSGHKAGVAGTYNRAKYLQPMKTALAMWADHIRALIDGSERKVVQFARVG